MNPMKQVNCIFFPEYL